jgi:hypothetical protein
MPDDLDTVAACPNCGAPSTACCGTFRRERDEARAEAEAEHEYARIVRAETEAMREEVERLRPVVEAFIAWADGIPEGNLRRAKTWNPQARRWNRMVQAVDAYRANTNKK